MHGALLRSRHRQPRADARPGADRSPWTATGGRSRRRWRTPPRGGRGGGPRGGTHDGADHPHRHREGNVPRQARAGASYPSRSPARPVRCRPRPITATWATAGPSATPPPSARRSRSRSSWATTRTGASRRPTSGATSSPSTSPPSARRLACWRQSSPRPGVPGVPKTRSSDYPLSTVLWRLATAGRDCPAPRKSRSPQHAALRMALKRRG